MSTDDNRIVVEQNSTLIVYFFGEETSVDTNVYALQT